MSCNGGLRPANWQPYPEFITKTCMYGNGTVEGYVNFDAVYGSHCPCDSYATEKKDCYSTGPQARFAVNLSKVKTGWSCDNHNSASCYDGETWNFLRKKS